MRPPRKLSDRSVRLADEGNVQFISPRWDWENWGHRVRIQFRPNWTGTTGGSLLTQRECLRLAEELVRRANDLGVQQRYWMEK